MHVHVSNEDHRKLISNSTMPVILLLKTGSTGSMTFERIMSIAYVLGEPRRCMQLKILSPSIYKMTGMMFAFCKQLFYPEKKNYISRLQKESKLRPPRYHHCFLIVPSRAQVNCGSNTYNIPITQ